MAPKKQKGQKMALSDFFAETTSSDWADDMDLPTAPAARDPSAGPRRGEPGYLDSMPDRGARGGFPGAPPSREELPLPTVPPFTAFVGNLTFETDEEELRSFFGDLEPTSVRLVKDATGKPKGFGYVEFPSQDKLKGALDRSMSQLGGRTVRVSVADAPANRREFAPSAAEESNQWRRATPLAPREAPAMAPRRGSSFNSPTEPGPDRDWGAARGARFVPAPPASGLGRDSSGMGREREGGREREVTPTVADDASQWRSAKPLVTPASAAPGRREAPPHQAGVGAGEAPSPSLAETESTWSRGTKVRTPQEPPSRSGTTSPDERDWRRAPPATTSAQGSADGESPRLASAAPAERRRLNLAPRSVPQSPATTAPEPASARASIFGGAKPIDSATKEKEAADKLAAKGEERRQAQIKAKEDEERKSKELAEERQRMIREAQEKAQAEVSGGKPRGAGAGAGTGAGAGAGGARPGRGGAPGQSGPGRRTSGDVRSPTSPRAKSHPVQTATEDGFEAVARGGARKTNQSAAAAATEQQKKDSGVKKGFSFAAAAMAEGLVDEDKDESGDNAVDEVTNGVKEVAV